MNLPELVENIVLDLDQLDRNVINNEIISNYSDHDLVDLTMTFLRGIGSRHSVNGTVVYNLRDICEDLKKHGSFTRKQQVYLIQNVIDNWHQMSVEMRAELML